MNSLFTIEEKVDFSLSQDVTLPAMQKNDPKEKKAKVIVLSGPTAVGKTKLSLMIAQAVGGEIVSADSMQVYRGMDIGTAKATIQERSMVTHYLINIRDVTEKFNVVDFYFEAHQAIKKIIDKGAVPIIVGGTGFYIRALIYGPPSGPPSISQVRERLESEMVEKGAEILYDRLKKSDPDYANTITANDKQKIIRGLEIISLTDQKVSHFSRQYSSEMMSYDFRCWFLHKSRETLYSSIEERCDLMIKNGLVEEVETLESLGLAKNLTASQAIGYKQCLDYLHSNRTALDWTEFLANFKQASRRYAKRQFTWFRREPLFRWLDMESVTFDHAAELIIQDYEKSF